MLSAAELVPYLQKQGLLSPAAVLDQPIEIERAAGRNQNLHATGAAGASYFVKQAQIRNGEVGTLATEAAALSALQELDARRSGCFLPRSRRHDAREGVLVLDSIPHAEDLFSYHTRTGRFPRKIAAGAGSALGWIHEGTRGWSRSETTPARFQTPRPLVLELAIPSVEILETVSSAGLRLVKLLQEQPIFEASFKRIASDWRTECLVHGDVRLRNFVTWRRDRRDRVRGVRLVDWEFASLGDPRWDVGAFLSSYLSLWATSVPITGGEERVDLARFPLERIQPSLNTFWDAYRRERGKSGAWAGECLPAATRCAAAHLVHTAYEIASRTSELGAQVVLLLKLALNILEDPERAVRELLGLELETETAEPC